MTIIKPSFVSGRLFFCSLLSFSDCAW